MSPACLSSGNLLINGTFLPGLWSRLAGAETNVLSCPVEARTFAADRWHVRYTAPVGGEVSQARSSDLPPGSISETSLEIRGGEGVTQNVYLGQTIEADEASSCRRELHFMVWCQVTHPLLRECPVRMRVAQPVSRDVFDSSMDVLVRSDPQPVAVNTWTRLDFTFEACAAGRFGLELELEFPATFLNDPQARVWVAAASLWPHACAEPLPRPNALETILARRFFQRHSAATVNAIGRALVCNPHELHFQFTFPEMRSFPAVTLSQDNDDLTVFSPDGVPQTGFVYDVPHRARGSAIIRATKWEHELRDGYLAFRGYRGAIFLEAEL